jgi:hypothetical protein
MVIGPVFVVCCMLQKYGLFGIRVAAGLAFIPLFFKQGSWDIR